MLQSKLAKKRLIKVGPGGQKGDLPGTRAVPAHWHRTGHVKEHQNSLPEDTGLLHQAKVSPWSKGSAVWDPKPGLVWHSAMFLTQF